VNRLRNIPRYTDFRLLERDLRAKAATDASSSSANQSARMLVAISGTAAADVLVPCIHSKQSDGSPQWGCTS
jgi:hypothetical protein